MELSCLILTKMHKFCNSSLLVIETLKVPFLSSSVPWAEYDDRIIVWVLISVMSSLCRTGRWAISRTRRSRRGLTSTPPICTFPVRLQTIFYNPSIAISTLGDSVATSRHTRETVQEFSWKCACCQVFPQPWLGTFNLASSVLLNMLLDCGGIQNHKENIAVRRQCLHILEYLSIHEHLWVMCNVKLLMILLYIHGKVYSHRNEKGDMFIKRICVCFCSDGIHYVCSGCGTGSGHTEPVRAALPLFTTDTARVQPRGNVMLMPRLLVDKLCYVYVFVFI